MVHPHSQRTPCRLLPVTTDLSRCGSFPGPGMRQAYHAWQLQLVQVVTSLGRASGPFNCCETCRDRLQEVLRKIQETGSCRHQYG